MYTTQKVLWHSKLINTRKYIAGFLQRPIYLIKYDVNMQQHDDKTLQFMVAAGQIFKQLRKENTGSSINKFAREYEFDRGNLSKIERGINSCSLITAWKLSEAAGVKFSEFAKLLEEKLGGNFKLIDE